MTPKTEILHCHSCAAFTLQKVCPTCRQPTRSTKPAKFSPEDKYGKYRRLQKKEDEEKGY